MKALKPYISEIKEKFKDNQDMQNRYTAKLFEDAKQNPLAGCLVSLAQLPIFLGLYRGVRLLAIDGEIDEPFLWIPSLQGPVGPPDFRGLDWLT
jgi:YidC/Oxa1 family membrane protein insertase